MLMQVKQKNPKWIEKLKLRYKQEPLEAAVGYPVGKDGIAAAHYPTNQSGAYKSRKNKSKPMKPPLGSGPSILEVAIWNNFGTETTPRRAFMELAAKNMQPKFKEMMKKAVKRINSGEITLKQVLKQAAQMGEAEVRKAIMEGDWPGNSPETVAEKQSETPLMDSGDMRKYVTSDVRARTR